MNQQVKELRVDFILDFSMQMRNATKDWFVVGDAGLKSDAMKSIRKKIDPILTVT